MAACTANHAAQARHWFIRWSAAAWDTPGITSAGAAAARWNTPELDSALQALDASLFAPDGAPWRGAEFAAIVDKVHDATADAADRRDLQFSRAHRLLEGLGAQRAGPLDGGGGILDLQTDVADRGAMHQIGGMSEAFRLHIDDDVDVALSVQLNILGDVPTAAPEAQFAQQTPGGIVLRIVTRKEGEHLEQQPENH